MSKRIIIISGGELNEEFVLSILEKEENLPLNLLVQIKNGADFGKLAKKHSICPSGKRGGDLGEFRQGQMVPAFDKVVFSCPVLEPTGPLHTQFGYHIIRLDDTREAQLPKFADVKPQIAQQLQQQKIAKFQEELRAKAKIE